MDRETRAWMVVFTILLLMGAPLSGSDTDKQAPTTEAPPTVTVAESPAATLTDCGFFNELVMTDPVGDGGDDPNVDIVSFTIRQWGGSLRFDLVTNGTTYNEEGADINFMVGFDLDQDSTTGLQWGAGLGVEARIWVWTGYGGGSVLDRYDASGSFIVDEEGPRVRFNEHGFDFALDASRLGSTGFGLYFEAMGGDPLGYDDGSAEEIVLEPGRSDSITVASDQIVLPNHPRTIHIASQQVGVGLQTTLTIDGVEMPLSPNEVTYEIEHPASHVVSDPESIISIDADGVAHYVSEGFIFARAVFDACDLYAEPLVIATGDVYGAPGTDDVIAIFPSQFGPGAHTFGFMMDHYPNYMSLVNTYYRVTRELYRGWEPLGGDTQVFALLDVPGACGGAGNPLQTAPCCYMNCVDGSPHYLVVNHEMGHNFHAAPGMWKFLIANWRFMSANVHECVASLPSIYFANEISLNGSRYGFGPGSWEWGYFNDFVENDRTDLDVLDDFEAMLDSGQTTGFFDNPGLFDSISLFCSFFQAHIYHYKDYWSPFGHEMLRRFINVFDGDGLPGFQDDMVETYFAAAFSAAAGRDLKDLLSHWGFAINDAYYDQVFPGILAKIPQFWDGFESGDTSAWSSTKP